MEVALSQPMWQGSGGVKSCLVARAVGPCTKSRELRNAGQSDGSNAALRPKTNAGQADAAKLATKHRQTNAFAPELAASLAGFAESSG